MDVLGELTAKDVMTHPVITVGVESRVDDVVRTFRQSAISGALVVGPDGEPLGVISMSDILAHLSGKRAEGVSSADFYQKLSAPGASEGVNWKDEWEQLAKSPLGEARVKTIMSPTVLTIAPTAALPQIARELCNRGIHRLFVEKFGLVLGVISTLDVLRALASIPAAKEKV